MVRLHWLTGGERPAISLLRSNQKQDLRTSGAMYAGVPTVDLGCESKTADLE